MPIDIETLAAEVAELRAIVRKPRKPKDKRRTVTLQVTVEEIDAIDAACRDHGVNRSDLIRQALNPVLSIVLPTHRIIPAGFRRLHPHHKTSRYDDGKTDRARLAQNLAHQTELVAADAAVMHPRDTEGMLAQPRPTKFPR